MNKIDIEMLINGNKDIIYSKDFFDKLRSSSLLEFRKNINLVLEMYPNGYLEDIVLRYYDSLLEMYDDNSRLFLFYKNLINLVKVGEFDLENKGLVDDFIDDKILIKISDLYHYDNGLEMIDEYLDGLTSYKISEIVIDGLFGDTIYNVFLNIKEMLRYNELLPNKETVLGIEDVSFYERILSIDRLDNKMKIEMYHKLKNKDIGKMFYFHLRSVKDLSYKYIDSSLFKINKNKDLVVRDKGVDIYKLEGEEFNILVRCQKEYSPYSRVRRNCYSLISDNGIKVYNRKKFIYGYSSVDAEDILNVFEYDAYSSSGDFYPVKNVNRVMFPYQIINPDRYNEIQIVNKRDRDRYVTNRPDYLVCFDNIRDKDWGEALRLGIPIVLIDTKCYRNSASLDRSDFKEYERIYDDYTDGFYKEDVRRRRR